jgi:inner membrane protein involved in colicin E2 resistance
LFFFFVVAILALVKKKELHPMHYLLLGCAFFAFHLLFAYLVDHLEPGPSFAIASAVSIALVVSYARLFVGWRFALVEMGLSQVIYLVLFSLTFFWEGYTGLAITIGAVVTLFLVMQLTGRFDFRVLKSGAPGATLGPRLPLTPGAPLHPEG